SCGFGAVVLLFLIIKHQTDVAVALPPHDLGVEVDTLTGEVAAARAARAALDAEASAASSALAVAQAAVDAAACALAEARAGSARRLRPATPPPRARRCVPPCGGPNGTSVRARPGCTGARATCARTSAPATAST